MDGETRMQLRLLKAYAVASTLLFAALVFAAFRDHAGGRARFEQIDVERINIVEKAGTVRLAIANPDRLPHPTFYGKEYRGIRSGQAQRGAGMIYFNDEGTEMGGFVWSGSKTEDGGHRAYGVLPFDPYNQNEAFALRYADAAGRRGVGLSVMDQPAVSIQPVMESLLAIRQLPEGDEKARRLQGLRQSLRQKAQVGARRIFAGRDPDGAATVVLPDARGQPRLRLAVEASGAPRLEFLDGKGKAIWCLPPPACRPPRRRSPHPTAAVCDEQHRPRPGRPRAQARLNHLLQTDHSDSACAGRPVPACRNASPADPGLR